MRNVKSFWTKPAGCFYEGLEELVSWSIFTAVRCTGDCEIFTDKTGAEWLAQLNLPLRPGAISRELDNAPGDGYTWNEGKIYCNFIQHSPFIQTDLDVLLGRDWARRIKAASIVCERHYSVSHAWAEGLYMNESWREAITREDGRSFACGTFGGNDLEAIHRIAFEGLAFIDANRGALKRFKPIAGALIAEEWAVCREYDWQEVSTVLPDGNALATTFCHFEKSYLHRQGSKKKTQEIIENTRERLEAIWPGQVQRCRDVRKAIAKVSG